MKTTMFLLSVLFAFLGVCSGQALAAGYVVYWGSGMGANEKLSRNATNLVAIAGQPLSNATAVFAGHYCGYALTSEGTVVGWGNNLNGQAIGYSALNDNVAASLVQLNDQVLSNVVAIAGERFTDTLVAGALALKPDGTVVGWGGDHPVAASNILSINGRFGWAVTREGTVTNVVWGGTIKGLSNIVEFVTGRDVHPNSFGLKRDGTVVALSSRMSMDDKYNPPLPLPPGVSNVVALAAGFGYTLALKKDGTVVGWGANGLGEATGTSSEYTRRGESFGSGLVHVGGQLLTNVVAIAAGGDGMNAVYSMALKADGTLVQWGHSQRNRLAVPEGLTNVVAMACGDGFCAAITTNAAVAERFRQK